MSWVGHKRQSNDVTAYSDAPYQFFWQNFALKSTSKISIGLVAQWYVSNVLVMLFIV